MNILVIDRDSLSTQLISSKIEALGHKVFGETAKDDALKRVAEEAFDCIFVDPAPMNDARAIVLGIRKAAKTYTHIVLLSSEVSFAEALAMGCNDVLAKPLNGEEALQKIENAQRIVEAYQQMGDESEDFPSSGGVISKSAFNQLFRSALDRGDRYGELSFIVSIGIDNYREIESIDGPYAAEYASSKLAQNMVQLRRQSDIVGQVGKSEYALLLQRPQNETEPVEAANRFATAFNEIDDIVSAGGTPLQMHVRLLNLPTGESPVNHNMVNSGQANQNAG